MKTETSERLKTLEMIGCTKLLETLCLKQVKMMPFQKSSDFVLERITLSERQTRSVCKLLPMQMNLKAMILWNIAFMADKAILLQKRCIIP